MQKRLNIVPIHFAEACDFVTKHHRHHRKPIGHRFSLAVACDDVIVGVSIVGRPVSRMLQDGFTLEVNRLATDGTPNACSALYAASWRVAREMGYRKLITYILASEPGTSLHAAGWKCIGQRGGGSWNVPSRPRIDKHPTEPKTLFEIYNLPDEGTNEMRGQWGGVNNSGNDADPRPQDLEND